MKSSLALTFFVSFFILSCHSDADDKLDLAEFNLAQRPDSSLVILESVSRSELNTEKRQSRYALLRFLYRRPPGKTEIRKQTYKYE